MLRSACLSCHSILRYTTHRYIALALIYLLSAGVSNLFQHNTVRAADITVSGTVVIRADDGQCSLMKVIDAANSNTVVDTCAAGNDNYDRVILQPNQTYMVTAADNTDGFAGSNGFSGITGASFMLG